MRKIILITSIFLLVLFDQGSKYLVESLSVRDYCVINEQRTWTDSSGVIGGLSPGLFCSPHYPSNKLAYYEFYKQIPLLGDLIKIKLSYNEGIAFSLPLHGLPLQIITFLLTLGLLYYYIRYEYPKNQKWIDLAFVLVLAWALSHGYERIFVGHVVDFIAVKYFAILNFADIFISIGACILFFIYYVRKQ